MMVLFPKWSVGIINHIVETCVSKNKLKLQELLASGKKQYFYMQSISMNLFYHYYVTDVNQLL